METNANSTFTLIEKRSKKSLVYVSDCKKVKVHFPFVTKNKQVTKSLN